MKIIGVINSYDDSREPRSFVVEMTGQEMAIVASGDFGPFKGDFRKVNTVDICDKFGHAMKILRSCREAKEIPTQLAVIASVLATIIPAIEEITAKEKTEDGTESAE